MHNHDVNCRDCGGHLGKIIHREAILPVHVRDAHRCKSCFLSSLAVPTRWLHIEKHPHDHLHMFPIPDPVVIVRGVLDDVHTDTTDLPVTVSLVHHDMREAPLPMLMGQTLQHVQPDGRAVFSGLYIRGLGKLRLKFQSEGYEPVYSVEFKVT